MDLLVHFPRVELKRNLGRIANTTELLDRALGTPVWRSRQRRRTDIVSLVHVLLEQLGTLGYRDEQLWVQPIKNTRGAVLYWLVCVSKHPLGAKIWASILRGQKRQGEFEF